MKVKSLILTLITVLMFSVAANAQYAVKCQINDSEGEGEPFATVRIYHAGDTSKVIVTGVSEMDGSYEQSLKSPGNYVLYVTAVGKVEQEREFSVSAAQKVADLGAITLPIAENMLQGVTVTSQKVLVKNEIDRIAYDVQSDADSKTNTAMDMLRKVPMVSVDAQDNIRVKGGSNFKIYKNGHPDATLSSNPKDVLKAIPASMIKRIEVITEPGAKYDAEGVGAILNIVMVDAGIIKGVTGTVGAMVDNFGDYSLNGYLTAQYGKFITSVNYGMFHMNSHRQHNLNDSEHNYVETGDTRFSSQESRGSGYVHFGNIEASYEPDTLNLLTFNFGGHYGDFSLYGTQQSWMTGAAGDLLQRYNVRFNLPEYGFFSFNGRFDYQHRTSRKDETLTLSYLLSTTRNTQNIDNEYYDFEHFTLPYDRINQANRENFLEQTFQFDWTRPFAKYHKIETGLKYIHRSNRSRTAQDFLLEDRTLEELSSITKLRHTTQVAALYLSYTFNKDKWSWRTGLRYEYSRLGAKFPLGGQENYHTNLNDWVPSASVNYQMDWANSFKLAFATRIARPGITYLNPAVVETPTSISYGDSHLASARNYSLSFTYMHIGPKFTYNISPSYDFSNDGITSVQFVNSDGKEVSTYANALSNKELSLNGFFQWQIHEKSSLMFNGGGFYKWLRSDNLGLKNKGLGGWFFMQLTQKLPWKLRLTANAGAWGGGPEGLYTKERGMWWHGFGLQRSFLKDDRLTVSIHAQNPFGGKYNGWSSRYVNGDFTGIDKNKWVNRTFGINISYRFGSLNASVKKSSTTIDNNDMVGGSKNSMGGGNNGQGAGGNGQGGN